MPRLENPATLCYNKNNKRQNALVKKTVDDFMGTMEKTVGNDPSDGDNDRKTGQGSKRVRESFSSARREALRRWTDQETFQNTTILVFITSLNRSVQNAKILIQSIKQLITTLHHTNIILYSTMSEEAEDCRWEV